MNGFWDNIAQAHRVDDSGPSVERPVLTPDPLESEPESEFESEPESDTDVCHMAMCMR